MDIENIVVVVSGGCSGLGEACVCDLTRFGAKVAILDVDRDKGDLLASALGEKIKFFETDVTDENSVETAINRIYHTFSAIHVSINCAGILASHKVLGKDKVLPMEMFRRVIEVNVFGTMNIIKAVAEKMVKNEPNKDGEKGVIVNTSSVAAFEGQIGQAAYSASKASIEGMTLPIAREFADEGIRLCNIAPGLFETPMSAGVSKKVMDSLKGMTQFPKRLGKPEEFARLAREIIGNPMLNGTTIRLDGGIRMAGK